MFHLGDQVYSTDPGAAETSCNAADKKRLIAAIADAKSRYDHVFVMIHCHASDNRRVENPPEFYREFAHAAIDAGVSAIFGGGCHRLRGIEIYKGAPIFYSLGDFIYQGPRVEILPADFMEKYDVDIFASAKEALWARSRGDQVGLHCNKLNYQTVLPRLEYEDGVMTGFKLLPVYLNFDRRDDVNGLPMAAEGKEAEEILSVLDGLSAPFGTRLKMEKGFLVLA
ncbi:MAG: CapA family protein [Lentisphaeria bacterium]|nr:CapA family protein [Lentisphaeria bacterium]